MVVSITDLNLLKCIPYEGPSSSPEVNRLGKGHMHLIIEQIQHDAQVQVIKIHYLT